jgi:hypothetical protein
MTQAELAKARCSDFATARTRSRETQRLFSRFELWPWYVFYVPVILRWLWLGLRHGNLLLPTLANPRIEAGGLYGESKTEILESAGGEARRLVAPFAHLVTSDDPGTGDLPRALSAMAEAGLAFPVVAKPDVGCRGTGVRVVENEEALATYLAAFPRRARVQLQKLINEECEAGILYVRRPGAARGHIFSLTLKYLPHVTGDGRSTLEELILADPRARRIAPVYLKRHSDRLGWIVPAGERFRLVFTGNHCKGAVFRDGSAFITPTLEARFDAIARSLPDYHFGRFDVRFPSLSDLMRGENLTIIEINGAGSEAIHIWDRDMTLREAYRVLFAQVGLLFEIGRAHRDRGLRPMKPLAFLRLCARQRRLMARAPQA